jgi:serine carboxypeptidase-like clade 1
MASSPFPFPLLLALVLLLFSLAIAAPENHLVAQLPGFDGAFPSKHYSGYVTVDESNDRRLFYYVVLSERDPATDPVVLWLNGGPGCSSFDGFVYDNGQNRSHLPSSRLNAFFAWWCSILILG